MEDTVSRSSVDSLSTGDEYVVVNAEPRLKIADNGDIEDLEKKLSEVLSDEHPNETMPSGEPMSYTNKASKPPPSKQQRDGMNMKLPSHTDSRFDDVKERLASPTGTVDDDSGQTFAALSPTSPMFPEGDCLIFNGVTYLGAASVNAPRSEMEINRNMKVMNEQTQMAIPVTLNVPNTSEGTVRLIDPGSQTEITSYRIHRILFCARGPVDTEERRCFAFTCSHGDSVETAIFQCHVFRCEQQDLVGKILYSFAMAFRRVPKSPSTISESSSIVEESLFRFNISLEFREDDGKGNFSTCPKDKNVFKLRCDVEKKIVITVQQVSHNRELKIERCFGLLISPGRNVKHGDMHLIDMPMNIQNRPAKLPHFDSMGRKMEFLPVEVVSMGAGSDGRSYLISGHWDPTDPSFQILNTETPKDTRVFMTIAVDLVIEGIQEPVRFLVETKAKIFPTNERFWYFTKKPLQEVFLLKIAQCEMQGSNNGAADQTMQFEVVSIETQTEMDRRKAGMSLTLSPNKIPTQNIQTPQDMDEESDGDEPLLSGSGVVSKDVHDENLLENWAEALTKWHANLAHRPKQVTQLVRKGVPEALRGEVWQLLAGCHNNTDMLEAYRILISKDSPNEQVILRDINRTFPAHDYFKETGGIGQDSLYKISKAYSVYDEEVGYCQGLSFLAAALLLHMPEEQAFCVLVKVMFDYGLRDLFKQGFEELHLKFYQLERLMQDQLPDLFDHFMDMGLEAHMYASQWFLTLFTAKFPLYMVFHILDLFLCDSEDVGKDMIFNVALALLKTSRKDLLALDFEGILKYFRVQLPKKYRAEENARELLQTAISLKVSPKKLKKYEKEYAMMKEQEMQHEDPVERMEREIKRLLDGNMRLEQENDDLAHELVTSKISLRNDLDNAEDRCDVLNKELLTTKSMLVDTEEEKKRLDTEATQLKEMCRRELDRAEVQNSRNNAIIADYKQVQNSRNNAIIADYKQICSQLSERLEKQQAAYKEELGKIKSQIQSCDRCCTLVSPDGQFRKIEIPPNEADIHPIVSEKDRQIRELELELAQTKLALVESECKTQDLTHELNSALTEIQASKNTWFQKTLTSIKEVTAKKEGATGAAAKEIKE